MRKDFRVCQGALLKGRSVYNLNVYDFNAITVNGFCRVSIRFVPNEEHGKGLLPIIIEFNNVDYFELSTGFGSREINEFDDLGYKARDDRDVDCLMTEEQAGPDDLLLFRFYPEEDIIRVHSETARLVEES